MRDVEDIMLLTLREVLAEGSGISSGNIWLKKPAEEFISRTDGPNLEADVVTSFPSIGINYMADAKFEFNNYGESIIAPGEDGKSTVYKPLGGLTLFLGVSLFTRSKADQRKYGANIVQTLLQNTQIKTRGDILSNEYLRCDLTHQRDIPDSNPHHKIFIIKLYSRILAEETGYEVKTIDTTLENEKIFTTSATGTIWM